MVVSGGGCLCKSEGVSVSAWFADSQWARRGLSVDAQWINDKKAPLVVVPKWRGSLSERALNGEDGNKNKILLKTASDQ